MGSCKNSSKVYATLNGSGTSHSCMHRSNTLRHLQRWKRFASRSNKTCVCVVPLVQKIIRWPHHNNHNLHNPTYNRNCPGNFPTKTTISTNSTSTASSLPTTIPKSMLQLLQLRRPITFRNRLPAKRSRTKTSATTSELLPYEPVWKMDLPITTTRNQQ